MVEVGDICEATEELTGITKGTHYQVMQSTQQHWDLYVIDDAHNYLYFDRGSDVYSSLKPIKDSVFYMVLKDGGTYTKKRHKTRVEAESEAKRLAVREYDIMFYVLKMVTEVKYLPQPVHLRRVDQ